MPEIDLNALEATARAATPGPWYQGRERRRYERVTEAYTREDMYSPGSGDVYPTQACREDAAYVAAFDPTTVLALIARLREAEQAMTELTKDEEVSVEGSIFRWSELPDVLARNMRAVTEARQEAKRWAIQVEESTARLREAEACVEEASTAIGSVNEWDGHGRPDQLDNTRAILSRYKTTKTENRSES